jgi:hypothetical protein
VLLKEGQQVTFTFAVNWLPTATPFGQRFERYLDYNFFEHKVCGVAHSCRYNHSCAACRQSNGVGDVWQLKGCVLHLNSTLVHSWYNYLLHKVCAVRSTQSCLRQQ